MRASGQGRERSDGREKCRHQKADPAQARHWREDSEFQRRPRPESQWSSQQEGQARPDGLHLKELGNADDGGGDEISSDGDQHGRSFGPSLRGQARGFPLQIVRRTYLTGIPAAREYVIIRGARFGKKDGRAPIFMLEKSISIS